MRAEENPRENAVERSKKYPLGGVGAGGDVPFRPEYGGEEQFWRSVLDSLSAHIAVLDQTGVIIAVNEAWSQFSADNHGNPARTGIGMNYLDICARAVGGANGEEAEEVIRGLQALLSGSRDSCEVEYPCHSPTEKHWFVMCGSRLASGMAGVAVFHMDITDRRQIAEALRESDARFRAVFEKAAIGISLVEARTRKFLKVNAVYSAMLGYSAEELSGMGPADVSHPDDWPRELELIRRLLRGKIDHYHIEKRYVRKDGQIVWSGLSVSLVRDAFRNPQYTVSVVKDITKRKQVEERLQLLNERLTEEHRQRKMLSKKLIEVLERDRKQIAMELHDHTGQIMTTLKMDLEWIAAHLEWSCTALEGRIQSARDKAAAVMRDIRDIAYGLRPSTLDTLGLTASIHALIQNIRQSGGIGVHFFQQGVPQRFDQDKEVTLYRVLQEALANVIKHAQATNVFVNLVRRYNTLSMSVEDDGVGFDPQEVLAGSTARGSMGLLIMKERVVQSGGELIIDSRIGGGTHLLVEVPFRDKPSSPAPSAGTC